MKQKLKLQISNIRFALVAGVDLIAFVLSAGFAPSLMDKYRARWVKKNPRLVQDFCHRYCDGLCANDGQTWLYKDDNGNINGQISINYVFAEAKKPAKKAKAKPAKKTKASPVKKKPTKAK